MKTETLVPNPGDIVEISWGSRYTVQAKVLDVSGPGGRYILLLLTPELSGEIVNEETTLTVFLPRIKRIVSRV